MRILISPSFLSRTFILAAFSVLALALSGCELLGVINPALDPDRVTTEVTEIPAGYPEGGTIRKTRIFQMTKFATTDVTIYKYPNGYESNHFDPEWRKKKPKKTSEQSVDSFNFSGQPGSSGRTSGSVIRTF